ncbi:MAG: hypothetical protein H7070_00710 [Saprospiraceae bacterium]|nr:hypothetical protein [Pyrinomonadaceae bacterium]
MNVFDDLIDELKAENLLETTVMEPHAASENNGVVDEAETSAILLELAALDESADTSFSGETVEEPQFVETDLPDIQKPAGERDFFRKRAMDEVSSLQMVEHVICGIEREYLKMVPVAFDDLEVKKALHRFLNIADLKSSEHAEMEYLLLQESEGWSSALAARDNNISVANIRRFCENSRPVLSSQALMALARFYRNSPYSEAVRGKFDFVMTRLFSRDVDGEKRRLLFPRPDMVTHIKTLYANWSSILVYSSEENETEISLAVSRFEDLIIEAETADTFDELLEVDFFNKIGLFKEDAAEMFYVPEIAAAAMECNVRVGNKYVDLIFSEREKANVASIEQKYGYTYDQIISDSSGKTLLLVNLLRAKKEDAAESDQVVASFDEVFPDKRPSAAARSKKGNKALKFEMFGVNKWFLAAAIVIVMVSLGVYLWADNAASEPSANVVAVDIDLGTSDLKEYLRAARGSSSETFYGILNPAWDALSEDEQKQFLQKAFNFATDKGFKRVTLMNGRGRTVAFASKEKFEIFKP